MIKVVLPSTLRIASGDTLTVTEPVATVADLIDVLDRRIPGFREQLDDSVFNFAINDEMLLHRARERALTDGDVVEIVPTISGGQASSRGAAEDQKPSHKPRRSVPRRERA
jgi:molybdopterin converting factor small subunit